MTKFEEAKYRSLISGMVAEMPYSNFARVFSGVARASTRERDKTPQEVQEYYKKLAELKRLCRYYKKERRYYLYAKTKEEMEKFKMNFHSTYGMFK